MTAADRIAAIRARLLDGQHVADIDIAFLLAEVERLTDELSDIRKLAFVLSAEDAVQYPIESDMQFRLRLFSALAAMRVELLSVRAQPDLVQKVCETAVSNLIRAEQAEAARDAMRAAIDVGRIGSSAGDVFLAATSAWMDHAGQCGEDTCAECDIKLNHMRAAEKVWRASRHKAVQTCAEPDGRITSTVTRCSPLYGSCHLASGHEGPHRGYPLRPEDLIASALPAQDDQEA